jgi:hypothetical protein
VPNKAETAQNVVQLAIATPDLSTLDTEVTAADLGGAPSGAGPFTVFAPTNAAFAAIEAAAKQAAEEAAAAKKTAEEAAAKKAAEEAAAKKAAEEAAAKQAADEAAAKKAAEEAAATKAADEAAAKKAAAKKAADEAAATKAAEEAAAKKAADEAAATKAAEEAAEAAAAKQAAEEAATKKAAEEAVRAKTTVQTTGASLPESSEPEQPVSPTRSGVDADKGPRVVKATADSAEGAAGLAAAKPGNAATQRRSKLVSWNGDPLTITDVNESAIAVQRPVMTEQTYDSKTGMFQSPFKDIDLSSKPLWLPTLLLDSIALPDKVALIDTSVGPTGGKRSYTYTELRTLVHQVAKALHARGFGRGSTLALVLPNCPEFVIAMLAAQALQGTVTAINPLVTADELSAYLSLAGAQWMVTCANAKGLPCLDRALALRAAGKLRSAFIVDFSRSVPLPSEVESFWKLFSESHPQLELPPGNADSIALVMFSSGTSGTPKGVELSHRSICSNLQQVRQTFAAVTVHNAKPRLCIPGRFFSDTDRPNSLRRSPPIAAVSA